MTMLRDAFIEHGLGAEWNKLPPDAQSSIRTFVLDSLGVGIAGAAAPVAQSARRAMGGSTGAGTAHIWGPGSHTGSPETAAFLNGLQIHCQEFDCVHEAAVVHPMATILAALMAACEASDRPVSGAELGVSLAVAVDLSTSLGIASTSPLKFFRPANAGIFGATLGIARLFRLERDQTRNALGFALSFCAGTMQAHTEGKPALPVQIGQAARNAVLAARLAAHGLEAAEDSLEGPYGYFRLFEDRVDTSGIADSLGRIWRITQVSHKPFPTGRAAQGGIMLMQRLRTDGIDPGEVGNVVLHAPPLIKRLVGRPERSGMTPSYARLCFPYCGAVALTSGTVGLTDFTPDALSRADVLELSSRISVEENEVQSSSAFTPQRLSVRLRSGELIVHETDHLPGSPAARLDRAENEAKFRSCTAFGFGGSPAHVADHLIAAVQRLETLEDAAILSRLAAGTTE